MKPNNMLRKYKVLQELLIGFKQKLSMKVPKDYYNKEKLYKNNSSSVEDN